MKKILLISLYLFSQFTNSAFAANNDFFQTPPPENRQLRMFKTVNEPQLGFILRLPANPEWRYTLEKRPSTTAIVIRTPEKQVPPLGLDIYTLDQVHIQKDELLPAAITATLNSARKLGVTKDIKAHDLQLVQYGSLKGYSYKVPFTYNKVEYDTMIFTGILGQSTPLHATFASTKDNLDSNEYYIYKILSMIKKKY